MLLYRCCCQLERLWEGGSCYLVLGSYICRILYGWMDSPLSQFTLLKLLVLLIKVGWNSCYAVVVSFFDSSFSVASLFQNHNLTSFCQTCKFNFRFPFLSGLIVITGDKSINIWGTLQNVLVKCSLPIFICQLILCVPCEWSLESPCSSKMATVCQRYSAALIIKFKRLLWHFV